MGPHDLRGGAQLLQPRERLTVMRSFTQSCEECLQVIADMHRHLRLWENTPHGTRQILATRFRNPAPPGIVDRHREAGLKDAARLLGKAASRKVDVPEFGVREAAAGCE
jgi:hypothetical protein